MTKKEDSKVSDHFIKCTVVANRLIKSLTEQTGQFHVSKVKGSTMWVFTRNDKVKQVLKHLGLV